MCSIALDTFLTNRLNDIGTFTGNVGNRENVGKEASELVTKWNTDHPNDQVTD